MAVTGGCHALISDLCLPIERDSRLNRPGLCYCPDSGDKPSHGRFFAACRL